MRFFSSLNLRLDLPSFSSCWQGLGLGLDTSLEAVVVISTCLFIVEHMKTNELIVGELQDLSEVVDDICVIRTPLSLCFLNLYAASRPVCSPRLCFLDGEGGVNLEASQAWAAQER